jgi:SpoVK/Ycf46/Vps4 family AAA+-type ATPase
MNNNNNNNNNNMNSSNKNDLSSGMGVNPTIINNYYYNKNGGNRNGGGGGGGGNRNRGRNRNRNNNQNKNNKNNQNMNTNKSVPTTGPSTENNQHIIIRSTNNPANMRIIPITQTMSPFAIHSSILKSFMEKNKNLGSGQHTTEKEGVLKVKTMEEIEKELEFVELKDINTLDDLIRIGEEFDIKDKRRYSIDMNRLKNIIKPLKELKNVIGMESVKKNIFEQLIFLLQELNDNNMMHTVIDGPPGVGKTLLGRILAKIYCKLKFLKGNENEKENQEINDIASHLMNLLNPNVMKPPTSGIGGGIGIGGGDMKMGGGGECKSYDDDDDEVKKKKEEVEDDVKFKIVRRSDLIGQYVGSTAIKTQKAIDSALGGVLFIDEVYSLGTGVEKHDTFAKEAIDCINQNLSENGDKFICIVAGYPDEIEKCFFSQNAGLKRRFPFKYSIEKYNSSELSQILEFKIKDIKWKLDENLQLKEIEKFIEKNKDNFKNFGGDIDNLLLNIKIKHSLRIFGKNPALKKIVTMEDIKSGYDEYVKIKKNEGMPDFMKQMFI